MSDEMDNGLLLLNKLVKSVYIVGVPIFMAGFLGISTYGKLHNHDTTTTAATNKEILAEKKSLSLKENVVKYVNHFLSYAPQLDHTTTWVLMEIPALAIGSVTYFYFGDSNVKWRLPNLLLMSFFLTHYFNRALIYPFQSSNSNKWSIFITLIGATYTTVNGYIQATQLGKYSLLTNDSLKSPRFILGVLLMICGWLANIKCDHILTSLRKPGESGYKIPNGFLFNYVSAANYFSELVEWFGFGLASSTPASFSFVYFTFANLAPRAHLAHQFYKQKFNDEYPKNRKAIIPFIW